MFQYRHHRRLFSLKPQNSLLEMLSRVTIFKKVSSPSSQVSSPFTLENNASVVTPKSIVTISSPSKLYSNNAFIVSTASGDDIQTHLPADAIRAIFLEDKPSIYQPYPGSACTTMTEQTQVILQTTTRLWTPGELRKLPIMGGPTLEQTKKSC
jgi:hypothetical protein